jgi:uncharacterized membrane protein HdeD (DUF308 family)
MTFATFVDSIVVFIDSYILPLFYALALVFFVWGIYRLFFSESEEKQKEGRQFAIWGIVGLVVLASVWTLVQMLVGLLTAGG